MKHTKTPTHLRLLPPPDPNYLAPSWERNQQTTKKETVAIARQMDKLHNIVCAVFLAVILLEIAFIRLSSVIYDQMGMSGVVTLMCVAMAIGVIGMFMVYTMGTIETSVRQELNIADDGEDDWYEEELDYV